jgi:hypothetical protein
MSLIKEQVIINSVPMDNPVLDNPVLDNPVPDTQVLDNPFMEEDEGHITPDEDGEYTQFIRKTEFPHPNLRNIKDGLFPIPSNSRILACQRENASWYQGPRDERTPRRFCRYGRTFKKMRKTQCKPRETHIALLQTSRSINNEYYTPIVFMTKSYYESRAYRQRVIATILCGSQFSIKLPMYIWWIIFSNFLENKNAIYHILRYRETFLEQSDGKWLGVPCIEASVYEELADDEEDLGPWRY